MIGKTFRDLEHAFDYIIPHIFEYGDYMTTEDGQKCKELRDYVLTIKNPLDCTLPKKFPMGERAVSQYIEQLLKGSKTEFVYDYHTRIFKHNGNIDQIEYIVNKLKEQPNSRRALAITWEPDKDMKEQHVPCLQFIQFLIRDNKLHMSVLFRSNDALLAFPANVLGLIEIGKIIASRLELELGTYTHHAVSFHIYVDRDKDVLKRFQI